MPRETDKKIYAIVPAKDEQDTIQNVIDSLYFADKIVVVNDGSKDRTKEILELNDIILINNPENIGYDKSLQKGIDKAFLEGADIVFTFDADGQHMPNDAIKMIEMSRNYDIVLGIRNKKPRFSEYLFAFFLRKLSIADPLCGLKVYKKNVYNAIGYFDNIGSIGTQLSIEASIRNFNIGHYKIKTRDRKDTSRFGINFKANLKILKALGIVLYRYWRHLI